MPGSPTDCATGSRNHGQLWRAGQCILCCLAVALQHLEPHLRHAARRDSQQLGRAPGRARGIAIGKVDIDNHIPKLDAAWTLKPLTEHLHPGEGDRYDGDAVEP